MSTEEPTTFQVNQEEEEEEGGDIATSEQPVVTRIEESVLPESSSEVNEEEVVSSPIISTGIPLTVQVSYINCYILCRLFILKLFYGFDFFRNQFQKLNHLLLLLLLLHQLLLHQVHLNSLMLL